VANKKSKAAKEKHLEKRAQIREQHQPIIRTKERKEDSKQAEPVTAKTPEAVCVEPKDNIREVMVQTTGVAGTPQNAVVVQKVAPTQEIAPVAAKGECKSQAKTVASTCDASAKTERQPVAVPPVTEREIKPATTLMETGKKEVAAPTGKTVDEKKTTAASLVHEKEPLVEPQITVVHRAAASPVNQATQPFPWLRYLGALAAGLLILLAIDFAMDLYDRLNSLERSAGKPVVMEGDKKPVATVDQEVGKKLVALEANLQKLQDNIAKAPQMEMSVQHINSLLENLNKRVDDLAKTVPDKQELDKKLGTIEAGQNKDSTDRQELVKKVAAVEANVQKIQENSGHLTQLEALSKQTTTLQTRVDGLEKLAAVADKSNSSDVPSNYATLLQNRMTQLEKSVESLSKPVTFDSKELENKIATLEAALQQKLNAKELESVTQTAQAGQQELQKRLDVLQTQLGKAEQESKSGLDNMAKKSELAQQELVNLQKTSQALTERVDNMHNRLAGAEAIAQNVGILQKQSDAMQQQLAIVQTQGKNQENTMSNLEQRAGKLEKLMQDTMPATAEANQKITQVEAKVQDLLKSFTSRIEALEKITSKPGDTVAVTPAPGMPEDVQKKLLKMVSASSTNIKIAVGKVEFELHSNQDREAVRQINFDEEGFVEAPVIYAVMVGEAFWTLDEVKNINEKHGDLILKLRRGQNIEPSMYPVAVRWIAVGKAGN
jgi:chromosome segregation ATPase